IVGKAGTAHANRLIFMTDAGYKGVPSRGLGRVENGNRACARRDHGAIGKPDPLALVLTEELVADSPVRGLVLAPVGVDLSSDFGGQCVSQAFHRSPRVYAGPGVILPPSGPSDECRAQVQSLVRHHCYSSAPELLAVAPPNRTFRGRNHHPESP